MIKIERPPNWDQIVEAFPHARDEIVLFAYGEDIYNPSNTHIPRPLLYHEYRHCVRQFGNPPGQWWTKYIADPEFRYQEELLGHVEEYGAQASDRDRNANARLLNTTALRLVAPLYNYQPPRSLAQALRDLKQHI